MDTHLKARVFWPTFAALMLFLTILWVPFGILSGSAAGLFGPAAVGLALSMIGSWRAKRAFDSFFAAGPRADAPSRATRRSREFVPRRRVGRTARTNRPEVPIAGDLPACAAGSDGIPCR